jgi:hypothetical protein
VKVPVETALISDDDGDSEAIVSDNGTHPDNVNNKNSSTLQEDDEELKSNIMQGRLFLFTKIQHFFYIIYKFFKYSKQLKIHKKSQKVSQSPQSK